MIRDIDTGQAAAERPAPPETFDPEATAFLFDYDGVLADIVDDPREARPTPQVVACLKRLFDLSGGAVAVVSGREIASLDQMLAPLKLPAAGIHGLERRSTDGTVTRPELDEGKVEVLAAGLDAFALRREGVMVERKTASVALHYRRRPELADECRALVETVAREQDVRLLAGKMVFELKLGHRTKADAIADFMGEPPFRGRRPVFAGDDVTDEDGFSVLRQWNGVSIKVGPGETAARYRLADMAAFRAWLAGLCANSALATG